MKYPGFLEGSILGHELVGKQENVDEIYTCTLVRKKNRIDLTVHQKIGKIVNWRKDRPWSPNDGPLKTIQKCKAIQAVLHDF